MTVMYEMKNLLFGGSFPFTNIPDLSVGMNSANGIASALNTQRSRKISKISKALYFSDKMIGKEISVCNVSGQDISYIEYVHRDGSIVPMLIMVRPGNVFGILTPKGIRTGMELSLLTSIVAAIYHNKLIRESLVKKGIDKDIMNEEFVVPLSRLFDGKGFIKDDLFVLCDWFYYAMGKSFDIEVTSDEASFQAEVKRLKQNGALRHCTKTRKPELIKISKMKAMDKKKQPSLYTEDLDLFYKRCRNGEFLVDYEWNDVQKKYVVPLNFLDGFIPTESFRRLLLSIWFQVNENLRKMKEGISYSEIMSKNPINVKIMGKPGSGKTTVIEAVLAALGYPKGLINCKDRMEEDEIEGLNKFVKGSIYNIPTKAGELHSVGGAILLEEFNLPDPGILQGCLGQALAYPFILKVDGYREYTRHPLTIYFATMNVGTNGSKPVNEALSSRFPEGHILEDVSKDEFVGILKKSGYSEVDCTSVYNVYTGIINYLRQNREDLVLSITLRHCLSALDKMRIGFTKEQAYEMTFISQIYSSDPEIVENIRNDVFNAVV